ncbi:RBR-type E3 ubiquitin transferase [Meloidogyne graminicola]|uniref:RBR-type E3 ubiquitin transferase n=1 Tax=Meloidogyne graminicola TaxID=189291 RepID=A0A8T0A1Z1_9BILA|nr:RBR-type E3 ubiquitin transferase [Meloidogyne graminicola]
MMDDSDSNDIIFVSQEITQDSDTDEIIDDDVDLVSETPKTCLPSSSGASVDIDYQILNQTELIDELNKISNETSAILGYNASICKALLQHFKWNKDVLIERFFESPDTDAFLKKSNLLDPTKHKKIVGKIDFCKICWEKNCLIGLLCNHLFCNECWSNYLSNKVYCEGRSYISCPEIKCNILADEEFVLKALKSVQTLFAYNKLILNSFVEVNKLIKWCPAVDCGRAVKVPHSESQQIVCRCGFIFCFQCLQQWHRPVPCDILKQWHKKCCDEVETLKWLNANTNDCPKCKAIIQKDGGCNHMTCRNLSCGFQFCWLCLGPWTDHNSGSYSCNRFEDASKRIKDAQKNLRSSQHYFHFYNRFTNHQNSLKLERNLFEKVSGKVEQMQQLGFSWIETQFLQKAVEVLIECRRTLMYTYVFAFYLKQNNLTKLFEDNQSDLELATEQLSEYLEHDLPADTDLVIVKQKVQDKYRYVEQRRQILLTNCDEGYEKKDYVFCLETLENMN